MKITLFSVLGILSSLSLQAQTYMAEGVDKDNIMNSTHFYDSGKGLFWSGSRSDPSTPVYEGVSKHLDGTTTIGELVGDLSSKMLSFQITATYNDYNHYAGLKQDSLSCWYQAGANTLEYWQQTYGVFAEKSAVSGYSYDKTYIKDFAGTQSLDMTMLFFDSLDGGKTGNFGIAAEWYLSGSKGYNIDASLKDGVTRSDGGYYAKYFPEIEGSRYVSSYATQAFHNTSSISTFTDRLATALGYTKENDGSYKASSKGQISTLHLDRGTATGHALTCYGFESTSDPNVLAIYLADSDDQSYELVKVYVKYNNGGFRLYADEGCNSLWTTFGESDWIVEQAFYVDTPESLKQLETRYNAADNAQIWSGGSGEWGGTDSTDDGGVATFNSGWVRYASNSVDSTFDGHFYSKDEQGRHVTFNDYVDKAGSATTSRSVSLAKDVQAPSVLIDNSSIAYTFEGNGNKLTADSITKQGSDTATFRDTVLQVTDIQVKEGRFAMENTQLSGSMTVSGSGELYVVGETSSIQSGLTLRTGASLEFSSTGDILTVNGDLSIESGFRSQGSVIGTLILKDGALLITSKGDLARAMSVSETALLSSRSAESALLNANLDLTAASGITTDGSALALGGTLMLSSERMLTLDFSTTPLLDGSNQLMIFTDLAGITVDGEATTNYLQYLTLSDSAQAALGQDATLKYDEATGELYVELANVPEPSTATLSLLALAGLVARRRRRC